MKAIGSCLTSNLAGLDPRRGSQAWIQMLVGRYYNRNNLIVAGSHTCLAVLCDFEFFCEAPQSGRCQRLCLVPVHLHGTLVLLLRCHL